jgi:hypothetical protein
VREEENKGLLNEPWRSPASVHTNMKNVIKAFEFVTVTVMCLERI